MKNFCALMMLSSGTPMFLAGDEFANTQQGNNNPYNRDDETTWLDWTRAVTHADLLRFFQRMIAFRRAHRSIGDVSGWEGRVHWHGVGPDPDLAYHSRSLAWFLDGSPLGDEDLYVMINAWNQPLTFTVQEFDRHPWRVVVDTDRRPPHDIERPDDLGEALLSPDVHLAPHSLVVLVGSDPERTLGEGAARPGPAARPADRVSDQTAGSAASAARTASSG
jgi:glycogen operon protein